jgi:hypothetical protein
MIAKSKFATCRHVKTNGRICQSPALTGAALCYFHRNLHLTHRRPADAVSLISEWQEDEIQREDPTGEDLLVLRSTYPHQDEIRFPALEDAESVQLATSMLFQAIATGQIAFKRARLLIAALKIACINQRALANSRAADTDPAAVPRRIVRTTHGDILAAPEEDAPDSVVAEAGIETPAATAERAEDAPDSVPTEAVPDSPVPQSGIAPAASLELPSLELEIHSSGTPPPANPNECRNLAITHLDAGFCRREHPAND